MGELLLSIPGLQFAFTQVFQLKLKFKFKFSVLNFMLLVYVLFIFFFQAPVSMKSVVTAAWFLNNAFGNLLVVLITELNIFPNQSDEFFFYAILMIIAIVIYTFLAYDYVLQERLGHHYASQMSLEVDMSSETTPLNNLTDDAPSTSNSNQTVVNV